MNDWRSEIDEKKENEKIKSYNLKNGSETVTFHSEGLEWFSQQDSKSYIIFKVQAEGDIVRPFFVNKKNHPFLRQLKALGTLTSRKVVLSRTGERSATRWSVTTFEQ